MIQSLNILILGLGSQVPTFINRRLRRLIEKGVFITVATQQNLDIGDTKGDIKYLDRLRVTSCYSLATLILLIKWLLKFPVNFQLWKLSEGSWIQRLKWCLEVQSLVGIKDLDIIHAQWLIKPQTIKFIREFYPRVTLIVSARGSQVTIYPRNNLQAMQLIKYNINNIDYIHCVSKDIAVACERVGASPQKLFVNYNGIDLGRFQPSAHKLATNSLRLISVGALIWRKGYLFQLQILKTLIDKGISLTLDIIGSGIDEQGLRYAALKMGIDQYVVFHGQKSESDIVNLLQGSDIYLSTSAAEGLPNSLVEAAACGLPIVTFECEGVMEIIESEVTGFIVPFGAVNEMVTKIEILTEQEVRKKMGELARRKMESEFDENYWVTEMVSRYLEIARKHTIDAK